MLGLPSVSSPRKLVDHQAAELRKQQIRTRRDRRIDDPEEDECVRFPSHQGVGTKSVGTPAGGLRVGDVHFGDWQSLFRKRPFRNLINEKLLLNVRIRDDLEDFVEQLDLVLAHLEELD